MVQNYENICKIRFKILSLMVITKNDTTITADESFYN